MSWGARLDPAWVAFEQWHVECPSPGAQKHVVNSIKFHLLMACDNPTCCCAVAWRGAFIGRRIVCCRRRRSCLRRCDSLGACQACAAGGWQPPPATAIPAPPATSPALAPSSAPAAIPATPAAAAPATGRIGAATGAAGAAASGALAPGRLGRLCRLVALRRRPCCTRCQRLQRLSATSVKMQFGSIQECNARDDTRTAASPMRRCSLAAVLSATGV